MNIHTQQTTLHSKQSARTYPVRLLEGIHHSTGEIAPLVVMADVSKVNVGAHSHGHPQAGAFPRHSTQVPPRDTQCVQNLLDQAGSRMCSTSITSKYLPKCRVELNAAQLLAILEPLSATQRQETASVTPLDTSH